MLRHPTEIHPRRSGRRWLSVLAFLGLVPLTLLLTILVPLALQARQFGGARTYVLSTSATYPPPGISGISGLPGGWNQQHLRAGDWVFEWTWLPRH